MKIKLENVNSVKSQPSFAHDVHPHFYLAVQKYALQKLEKSCGKVGMLFASPRYFTN